ncbi:MAG: NTP transferase domain-containing protein, partial [Deltaproteobacteria bacterium]|nr:NTP transferase domain-containing protein [Deltaproteobacteria bacterium]
MKTVILAGGAGSRLSEETVLKPKAMVEIGGMPIIWHVMMHYAAFGFNDFVIALGYMGDMIQDYLKGREKNTGGLGNNNRGDGVKLQPQNWSIELVDTGISTQTGG